MRRRNARTRCLVALALWGVGAAGAPDTAEAQLWLLARDGDGLSCLDPPAVSDCTACPDQCGTLRPATGMSCHHGESTFLCCAIDSDCVLDTGGGASVRGQCDRIEGLLTSAASPVFGICSFSTPPWDMHCGVTDVPGLSPCLPPTGSDWRAGDCDGDGTANGADTDPCVAAPDSGIGGGGGNDGSVAVDGGVRDAASPPPRSDLAFDFRGGGGCVCKASRTSGGAPAGCIGAGIVVLATAVRARRRREPAGSRSGSRRTRSRPDRGAPP